MMRGIDSHLKYCILEENLKLKTTGRKRARAFLQGLGSHLLSLPVCPSFRRRKNTLVNEKGAGIL